MKKLIVAMIVPSLIFAQAMPDGLGGLDSEYLKSLPESVRDDIQDEIQKNQKEDSSSFQKRPSSELLKYDLVNEWEQFKRAKNEELIKSERYGLNLFRSMQSSFMPINEPNFGTNYIVDYGDIIEINLFGFNSFDYELEVKRDGTINIPELGSMVIGGLNYEQVVEKIQMKIESSYTGTNVVVNLKEIRDIKILITGNVEYPGMYTVSGNSNLLQALNMAGGVSETGTLRDIEIKRNGITINNVDLYKSLIFGDTSGLNQLHSGDAIYVKPAEKLIRAGSGFINQALFELKNGESIKDFLNIAGGIDKNVQDTNFTLVGVDGNIETSLNSNDSKYNLKHLDSIYFSTSKIGSIQISGEVSRPGVYTIQPGDDLYDLIKRAGGYTEIAYPFASVLKRKDVEKLESEYISRSYKYLISFLAQNPTSLQANSGLGMLLDEFKNMKPSGRVVAEFDPQSLKDEPSKRILLNDKDEIFIPAKSSSVYVFGDVGNPQTLNFNDMLPARDYIAMAGGANETANKSNVIIISPNGEAKLLSLSKFPNLLSEEIDIYPGTLIYVPQKFGSVQGVEFYSVIAPIFSSLALSLASLNSIK